MVKRFVCALLGAFMLGLLAAGSAGAVTAAAGWRVDSFATPGVFSTSDNARCISEVHALVSQRPPCDSYRVSAVNVGSRATDRSTVTLADTLPAGLTVRAIEFFWSGLPAEFGGPATDLAPFGLCTTVPLQCQLPSEFELPGVAPFGRLEMLVYVTVDEPSVTGPVANTVTVSGGGAASATYTETVQVGSGSVPFGVGAFRWLAVGVDGMLDSQAGSHPYDVTMTIGLNSAMGPNPQGYDVRVVSVHDLRDAAIDLPVGFVGSALATPECTLAQLSTEQGCPVNTQVGYIKTEPASFAAIESPLWNVVPERGVPAEVAFRDGLNGPHIIYLNVVATPAGYVLRGSSPEISQVLLTHIDVSLYGNPALVDGSGDAQVAQFTNPSDCSGGPVRTGIHIDSWQAPGSYNADGSPNLLDANWASGVSEAPGVSGCNLLQFTGTLGVQPETTQANGPSGLGVDLKIPQSQDPNALGTPPVRKVVVTLPAGVALDPSAAGGLAACSLAQIGLGNNSQPTCPEAAKVGSVEATTPALAGVLQGSVYVAAQNENPFGTLLALYVVVDDPATGVLVKIPGRVDPDPVTGQLTATFDQAPQFPVSDLQVRFFGGPRAPLTMPSGCGSYTTSAVLTPWSAPDSGPPALTSDAFQVTGGCANAFNPGFTAGTTNNQAGGFSPFTATFSRGDEDQRFAGITVTTPPGLLGTLKGVEQCPEPQASQGTCGANSLIGHTTAGAGSGPDPFYVQGGQVFLTGPYKGAPFGLSFVIPAVAGPFNLGDIVVRAAIHVDPHTAQITVVSDPLPTILQGIPLDVRVVNVTIDRSGFMFNPTSCNPLSVTGVVSSTQGATANLASRFQAANCANLSFKPVFKVSTLARTSKQNGASLSVNVTSGAGQANIGKVAVTLPKQLPSRLTTIQQACPEATFAANPASCPAGSDIGTATGRTPVLAGPVVGPAYLVSHGGAAFPDLVLILQGEGVMVELVGSIDIKHGVTSSAFNAVPDVPISSFALSLPQGPHSALAATLPAKAKGSLCGTSLVMPTTITGQNGAQVKQNTKIAVTGCGKAKPKTKKKPRKHKSGKRRK